MISFLVLTIGMFGNVSHDTDQLDFKNDKTKEFGVITLKIATKINASADDVWEVLGKKFDSIDEWSSTIESSELVKFSEVSTSIKVAKESKIAGRRTVSKRIKATEILTEYSDQLREFTFVADETPAFIKNASNHTTVVDLGAGECEVVFDITIKLGGPISLLKNVFKKKLTSTMKVVHNDLKTYMEARFNGQISGHSK